MRGAPSPSPRRGCGRPRRGSRSATRRCGSGGGAAAGMPSSLRAPIAGRVAEVYGDARRLVRRRRAALQDRRAPIASSCRCRCRRPMRRGARRLTALALEIPGRARSAARCSSDHVHDAGVLDPTTRALPVQIEVDEPGRRAARSARPAPPFSTPRRRSGCRRCRRPRC